MIKILGALIFAWGLADLGMGLAGNDLWGMIGVQLPDIVWRYSHYIAMAIGGFLFYWDTSEEAQDEENNA